MLARAALGQLEPLAQGGTARIYRLPGFSIPGADGLVYKEYKPKIRQRAGPALLPGLLALTRFPERLPAAQRSRIEQRVIWPLRVVTDPDGSAAGIVMRLIPQIFMQPLQLRSGATAVEPRELGLLFQSDDDARRLGLPEVPVPIRLAMCARIAASYALLHGAEVIVGDVSGRNVLYSLGAAPGILVVDVDSARVRGSRSAFGDQPHTPLWEPPEALAAKQQLTRAHRSGQAEPARLQQLTDEWLRQTKASDVYKFALMVVRLLDYGRYRSGNRDPARAYQVLSRQAGRATADLLTGSLDPSPGSRPGMRDWYLALGGGSPGKAAGPGPGPAPAARRPGPPVQAVGEWRWVDGSGWVRGGTSAKQGS